MLLTGVFSRAIDDKLRVAIPKRLREVFGTESPQVVYIAPGTDQSLALYTEEVFCSSGRSSWPMRFADAAGRADVQPVVLRSGAAGGIGFAGTRMRIPPELAELARLDKEVVLLGVQDHMEVWSAQRWQVVLWAETTRPLRRDREAAFQ